MDDGHMFDTLEKCSHSRAIDLRLFGGFTFSLFKKMYLESRNNIIVIT